jgi:hypothetical protein
MKTPIGRTREMALRSFLTQIYDEVSRTLGADAPTLAGVVISSADAGGEARPSKPALPLGCVFAVRYSSR